MLKLVNNNNDFYATKYNIYKYVLKFVVTMLMNILWNIYIYISYIYSSVLTLRFIENIGINIGHLKLN